MLNIFLDQLILVSSEPEEYFSKLMDIFRSRGLSSVAEGHFSKQRATYLPSPTLRDIFQIREILSKAEGFQKKQRFLSKVIF